MAIAIATTRQSVANHYSSLGNYIGLATGNPGTTSAPANEVTGGSPAYARKSFTWTPSTGGVVNGAATALDTPANTITHVILCSGVSGSNMIDWADISPDVVMSAQGQVVVTPVYTQL